MSVELFVSALIAIFVMADPFGNIPIFLGLTDGVSGTERRYLITRAGIAATIILIIFALVGKPFMDVLSISINSLRIAGGMLLMVIAFDMLMGTETRTKRTEGGADQEDLTSLAITPMAMPLIVGPGVMTVTLVYMNEAIGWDKLLVMAAILVAMFLSWLITVNSDLLYSLLRKDGTRVLTKIMGIILAAIAAEMLVAWLQGSFPGLHM
jgi:multiple antibiotic resistance protein